MSEELNPGIVEEQVPDVVETPVENQAAESIGVEEEPLILADKSLAELSELLQKLMEDEDRMKKSKEAEAIKSAFYKKLSKEKADAGIEVPQEQADEEAAPEEVVNESGDNPFEAIESGFKALFNKYRRERAEYNRQQEAERSANLVRKQEVIAELKALIDSQDDVSAAFPQFRALQARWRETGPVPAQDFRTVNDTYQYCVEQFYDKVQMNREMRDLDFRKNLEAKQAFCEEAEKLAENENVLEAFKELQSLHERWKELGPVAKEYREQIWDRFKAATAVINKKYQAYFIGQKEQQAANLAAKTLLCEQVEAIADKEDITSSNEWNELSKQIEDIQKQWRTIGFASRKENQKIYDRFRAACDKFYGRKREFYNSFKDSMNENMEKKLSLIEQAEALKTSTDWKKTTDQLIALQKQWKEIGAVPRKKSEQLWKRFRAACDEFFAERDKQAKPENNFYANLKAKKALIEEIKAFNSDDPQLLKDAAQSFNERWKAIGFVPFKEKDAIAAAYREAMEAKFPGFDLSGRRGDRQQPGRQRVQRAPLSEKDRLVQKYNALQQDIDTYENNIGFFAASKNAETLIAQMQVRIDAAKKELKDLEARIRTLEESQE
ncbi:MAG: DUF349 domain-containing protein [Candidatus Cryptobacteroides sp.]